MGTGEPEERGITERIPVSWKQVDDALMLAKRDIQTAEKNLEIDADWAVAIAYNSMLQAARAYMFSQGVRPKGSNQHYAVCAFIEEAVGGVFGERLSTALERMRRTKHRLVYEQSGITSHSFAESALGWAQEFMEKAEALIKEEKKNKLKQPTGNAYADICP